MPNQPRGIKMSERRLAVLYLRSASGRQADRDMAIVAQQHVCAWRAHELGANIEGEFVDFGSGLSLERPGLTAMFARLTELRAQYPDAAIFVIAADHARVGRSTEAYGHVSWEVEQRRAQLNIASTPQIVYDRLADRASGYDHNRRPRPPGAMPEHEQDY